MGDGPNAQLKQGALAVPNGDTQTLMTQSAEENNRGSEWVHPDTHDANGSGKQSRFRTVETNRGSDSGLQKIQDATGDGPNAQLKRGALAVPNGDTQTLMTQSAAENNCGS
jgi:hypothetical protein